MKSGHETTQILAVCQCKKSWQLCVQYGAGQGDIFRVEYGFNEAAHPAKTCT